MTCNLIICLGLLRLNLPECPVWMCLPVGLDIQNIKESKGGKGGKVTFATLVLCFEARYLWVHPEENHCHALGACNYYTLA